MILFDKTYPKTLATLADTLTGSAIQIWSFDDRQTRAATEAAFAARGIQARCRSAYKPLVCAFREEIDTQGLIAADITYPRHPAAGDKRFLLESYPLSALFPAVAFSFTADEVRDAQPEYLCRLSYDDGRKVDLRVIAPNRRHQDYSANDVLSPCGWLDIDGQAAAITTEFEALFHDAMQAIATGPWEREPYFPELNISVSLPASDEDLGYGDEVLSLTEALHEDFYFSCLELFQRRSGKPTGARDLQPGQIVPEIRTGETVCVKVEIRPLDATSVSDYHQDLATADRPLSQVQIAEELAKIGGVEFHAQSVAGRQIAARYHAGTGRAIIISAGQHANETTSPIGCLLAAQDLAAQGAHFVISPLENPDGYALHQRLIADNPRHMHHAARYTALGDDLEYRTGERLYEKAIRLEAEKICPALLHVNCHGYPSHEWTRPLSGYIPRAFEMWTVPKGFFLVLRHAKGWSDAARALMQSVTAALNDVEGLLAYNQAQIALFNIHAGETGFEIMNGFPVLISEDPRHNLPMTLITEYPDETIYGDAMRAGHAAQQATVLTAYQALQDLDTALMPSQDAPTA